jgi:hypothetical protein
MQQRHPIPKRATAEPLPAHRAGHYSGLHPEDVPFLTAQRKRYPDNPLDLADDLDYPEERTRLPTSTRRYTTTAGNQVIERGNKRFVIHDEPPPHKRKVHWVVILWIGMLAMLALYLLWNWSTSWWTDHQLYATYGFPRTFQTDGVVGHTDSTDHPSHFIFLNLNGHVLIIEFPGGDATHAKIYSGPQIFADNPSSVPVTGEFKDVNGDGKIDLIVHIGEQKIIYLNTGTDFKPQQ